jgi:cell division septation protein DedD
VVTAEQQDAVDVDESADFFDTVGDGSGEPSREVARSDSQAEGTPPGGGSRLTPGEYYVQVFAGRDESAAASLVSKLEAEGQPVGMHLDRQGGDSLYKVRVGGYATQDEAREAARSLQEQGYAGAWVTKAD